MRTGRRRFCENINIIVFLHKLWYYSIKQKTLNKQGSTHKYFINDK